MSDALANHQRSPVGALRFLLVAAVPGLLAALVGLTGVGALPPLVRQWFVVGSLLLTIGLLLLARGHLAGSSAPGTVAVAGLGALTAFGALSAVMAWRAGLPFSRHAIASVLAAAATWLLDGCRQARGDDQPAPPPQPGPRRWLVRTLVVAGSLSLLGGLAGLVIGEAALTAGVKHRNSRVARAGAEFVDLLKKRENPVIVRLMNWDARSDETERLGLADRLQDFRRDLEAFRRQAPAALWPAVDRYHEAVREWERGVDLLKTTDAASRAAALQAFERGTDMRLAAVDLMSLALAEDAGEAPSRPAPAPRLVNPALPGRP